MANIVARNAVLKVIKPDGSTGVLSGDSNQITLSRTLRVTNTTKLGDCSEERTANSIIDWKITVNGYANYAASSVDDIFDESFAQSIVVLFGPSGSGGTDVLYHASALCTDYSVDFPLAGVATYSGTFIGRSGSLTKGTWS